MKTPVSSALWVTQWISTFIYKPMIHNLERSHLQGFINHHCTVKKFDCQKSRFYLCCFSQCSLTAFLAVNNCKNYKTCILYNSKFFQKGSQSKTCMVDANICSVLLGPLSKENAQTKTNNLFSKVFTKKYPRSGCTSHHQPSI